MRYSSIVIVASLAIATAAPAHQGVQNPAVKARMDAMAIIGKNTKVIGYMVKGAAPFDAARARAAAGAIAEQAAQTPTLFEAAEDDPKSEALPAIWKNFADFEARAGAMQTAARTAAQNISTPRDLRAALAEIGATCKACHSDYRE